MMEQFQIQKGFKHEKNIQNVHDIDRVDHGSIAFRENFSRNIDNDPFMLIIGARARLVVVAFTLNNSLSFMDNASKKYSVPFVIDITTATNNISTWQNAPDPLFI